MNSNEYNILNIFNKENRPLFFREISKISGVSIGGTQKVLKDYGEFFNKEIRGKNTYFSLKGGIDSFNISKLIEIERTIRFIKKNFLLKDFFEKLILMKIPCLVFGSHAIFTNKKDSDLDLVVLGDKKIPEHLCPTELHLIRLSKKDFEKSIQDNLFREIKRNHILIYGLEYFLEVFEKNEKN